MWWNSDKIGTNIVFMEFDDIFLRVWNTQGLINLYILKQLVFKTNSAHNNDANT